MEHFDKSPSIFAILTPANKAARDSFSQVAQRKSENPGWNPHSRQNIKVNKKQTNVMTYSNTSESDGGTGPSGALRPIWTGCYTFDLDIPPKQPNKGWLIGGGKFSGGDERPEILLTERKNHDGVSSRHARLAHNFASGALVITASDSTGVLINGHEVVDNQRVIHGRTTSLEFGQLKYTLEVRKYDVDLIYRHDLWLYKRAHGLEDDDYPVTLLATPADSDLVTKNYIIKNPVGEGATSVVYAAHDRRNGASVAIKKVRRNEGNANFISQDIKISEHLGSHNRICQLMDVIDPAAEDPSRGYEMFGLDEVFLVYSPLASWTVEKLIQSELVLDKETQEEIYWQLLEGIEFLHSMDVMHRDIKPLNMAVVSLAPNRPQARLIDFGLAKRGLESWEYNVGTSPYLAPEMWDGLEMGTNRAYDERVDVFAFGLSMYQFFCKKPCHWGRIDTDDKDARCGDSRVAKMESSLWKSGLREKLVEQISLFMSWNPKLRPTARSALHQRPKAEPEDTHDYKEYENHGNMGEEYGNSGLGNSMGRLNISAQERTSDGRSHGTGSSRSGSTIQYYQPSPHHHVSDRIRKPRGWSMLGNEHERNLRSH